MSEKKNCNSFLLHSAPNISISDLMTEKENKSIRHLFIDIRKDSDLSKGIIPSSMTLFHFETEFIRNPMKFADFHIIFICENGAKSLIYAQNLLKNNRKFLKKNQVSALIGVISAYQSIFPLINPITFKSMPKQLQKIEKE